MVKAKQNLGMVDVSEKAATKRTAIASAKILMDKKAYKILVENGSPKGNVLEAARTAGIMAAKKTPSLIPMCHPLELSKVKIDFQMNALKFFIEIKAEVVYQGKTGVEMEALTAVSIAALTIYDMMKWADKAMVISDVKLLYKSGGKSGTFKR